MKNGDSFSMLLHPMPVLATRHHQSRNQRLQLPRMQRRASLRTLGPGKPAALQPFIQDPQPTAIPEKDFKPVALGEHEPMPRKRVLAQDVLSQSKKPVKTPAQIHGRESHKHASRRSRDQHERKSCRTQADGALAASRTRAPEGKTTSATHAEDETGRPTGRTSAKSGPAEESRTCVEAGGLPRRRLEKENSFMPSSCHIHPRLNTMRFTERLRFSAGKHGHVARLVSAQ